MKTQFKQFIKNIDTRSLVPMAVFVSIIAFLFWPLKSLSDTASLPCTMLAKSFCMFVLGCYVSEILKGKISRKGFKFICILAVIFCLHIFIVDGIDSLIHFPPVSILWLPWDYVNLTEVHPFFICLGMIANYHYEMIPDRPYSFRKYGSMKRDIFLAIFTFIAFVATMYGLHVPAFFENMSVKTTWAVRYIIRILCFPSWVMLMIYLYKCLTSKWTLGLIERFPKVMRFISALAPVGFLFIVFNSTRPFSIYLWFDILYYPLLAYLVVVTFRFIVHLIKALVRKDFGWKEIFLGHNN